MWGENLLTEGSGSVFVAFYTAADGSCVPSTEDSAITERGAIVRNLLWIKSHYMLKGGTSILNKWFTAVGDIDHRVRFRQQKDLVSQMFETQRQRSASGEQENVVNFIPWHLRKDLPAVDTSL